MTSAAGNLEHLLLLVDRMEVGIHVYHLEDPDDDRTLRFIGANPAAARITGVPNETYLGNTLDENFPDLRTRGIPQAYAEVVRTGVAWAIDELVYGDDRVLHAAYAVRAFQLPGACVGVAFEDATARVRAQHELRRSEARMRALLDALPDTLYQIEPDGRIAEVRGGVGPSAALGAAIRARLEPPLAAGELRRFELDDAGVDLEVRLLRTGEAEQLAIVRDISERKQADRRKDEFVRVVSHELRTPLTSIHGALGLLDGGVLGDAPAGMADLVKVARDNTARLVRLLNDMLDLDKMEAGAVQLALAPLDATLLADAAVEVMRGAADTAGVRLRRVTEGNGAVLGDRDRLVQVLANLLSNALRFSPPQAAVVVTVRVHDGRVRIQVADEGPGVPPERVDRLFQKFAQLGDPATRRRGGSGLGLAISRAIAEQHGGALSLVETARGATFALDLPVHAAPPALPEVFADLRAAYRAAVPPQVAELSRLVGVGRRDEAAALAHRLLGTAGTYGFPEVSGAAGRVETLLRGGASPVAVADALAALRAAAG